MNRIFALVLVTVVVTGVAWLGATAHKIASSERAAAAARAALEEVDLIDLEDVPVRVRLRSDRPSVLVFFTTACDYCRSEIRAMMRRAESLRGARVALISPDERTTLHDFVREMHLDLLPVFRVLHDPGAEVARQLGIRSVPTTLIYDARGSFAASLEGLTPVDEILARIRELP